MKTKTDLHSPFLHSNTGLETYGVVENQNIGDREFNDLVVSGALISFTSFKNVTFRSCVFFASHLENTEFANCTFIDCKFQFSQLEHCQFANTSLQNCVWEATVIKKNLFYDCSMDYQTSHKLLEGNNRITLDPDYALAA